MMKNSVAKAEKTHIRCWNSCWRWKMIRARMKWDLTNIFISSARLRLDFMMENGWEWRMGWIDVIQKSINFILWYIIWYFNNINRHGKTKTRSVEWVDIEFRGSESFAYDQQQQKKNFSFLRKISLLNSVFFFSLCHTFG